MTGRRALRADARRNLDRLLRAARTAFAEHGADASLEGIARRAGVGIGTLYRHFPARQTLLEAVFGDGLDRLTARAVSLLGEPSAEAALRIWLRELAGDAAAPGDSPRR